MYSKKGMIRMTKKSFILGIKSGTITKCIINQGLLKFTHIICDRLQENRAQRGVRKYREKIDRFF